MEFLRELTDTELDAVSGGAVGPVWGASSGANFGVGVGSAATVGASVGSTGIPNTLFGAIVAFNNPGVGVALT